MSKEDIWNSALAVIGGPDSSDYVENADTDTSQQAIWLRILWPSSVDHSVVVVEPRDALRFKEISQTGDDVDSADYDYVFDRPPDCLLIKKLTCSTDRTQDYEFEEFGQYIMSDYGADYLEYYKKMDYDETAYYSNGLADVISGRLAWRLASVWKKDMIGAALQYYNMALDNARATNQKGQYREKQPLITEIS